MAKKDSQSQEFIVRPSLPRNILFSVTCIGFGVLLILMAHEGRTEIFPAYLVALLMTAGSAVLLGSHLPNASFLRLTREGFEIRELFKSRHYNWNDVGQFATRRKLLGSSIVFIHLDPDTEIPQDQTVPTGYTLSSHTLLETMNEWRDRWARPRRD
ncbi:MAG: hypothetical protein H8D70_01050 [Rhodospirillaceae bacterium]|nr:hypothetical protein [Rhodospirillaceae bacterium]